MSKLISLLKNNDYELNKEDIENNKNDIGAINFETVLMLYLQFNKNPSIEIIKLLEKEKYIFSFHDTTPFMYYCKNIYIKNINIEIIKYFSDQICKKNICGETALIYYLEYNINPNLETIKLLENEINIPNNIDTYLICYCRNRNIENLNPNIINYFSNQIGLKDMFGKTALMRYCKHNKNLSIEIIKLLEKEKDIFDISNNTSFMCCCENIYKKKLDPEILEYFSNQIGLKNTYEETALMFYLRNNENPSIEIVKLLEKEKDIVSIYNTTHFMYYCMNINIEYLNIDIIEYFLDQINCIDYYKYNVLHYYLNYNKNPSIEIVKLLENNIKEKFNDYLIQYYQNNTEILNPEIIKHFEGLIGFINEYNDTALINHLNCNDFPKMENMKYLYKEFGYVDFKKYTNVTVNLDIY